MFRLSDWLRTLSLLSVRCTMPDVSCEHSEGADLDGRRLRIIVALGEGVLVVTAVVLEDAP